MMITIWIRPYKNKIGNIVKIGGEACLATAWLIYLLKFIPFQTKLLSFGIINKDEI